MKSGIYRNVELIDTSKHQALRIRPIEGFGYASSMKDCIITSSEFYAAAASQPIVFSKSDTEDYFATTVLGLASDHNYFVDSEGNWKPGEYIPAYIRRYPFIFAQVKDSFALAVDIGCDAVNKEEGHQIVSEEGKPSAFAGNVMKFLKDHQADYDRTRIFIGKLDELGILEDASAQVRKGDETFTVAGFKRVNEEKFNALDKDVVYELHCSGYYKLVISHLMSMRNFNKLLAG